MNIKNKYCLLSALNQDQIDKLVDFMPNNAYFDFQPYELYIGFNEDGESGTWVDAMKDEAITYKEMLSLLGVKEEEKLVPHVHQKEIIAWANGEEIEYYSESYGCWYAIKGSSFAAIMKYRVKPKLTPTQLRIKELTEEIVKLKEQDNVECGIDKVMGN
jgi:TfoX/Sxy family transcriptional regulator of competence genes